MIGAKPLKVLLTGLGFLLLSYQSYSVPEENKGSKTHTVEIVQMKFKPAEILANKGDKIVFINRDMVAHNVTETSGKSWKSPDLATGKSWSMTVTKSAAYYCSLHPVMKGKITVKK